MNSKILIRKNYPIIIRIAGVHLYTVSWTKSIQISHRCFVKLLLTKPCIHTNNRQTDRWFKTLQNLVCWVVIKVFNSQSNILLFLPFSRPNACSVREFLLLTFDLPTWIVPWGFSGMKTATNRAMMTRIAPKANGGPGTTLCNNEQTLSYFSLHLVIWYWRIYISFFIL